MAAHPDFAERVQKILEGFRNQSALSDATGIKRSTLGNYVQGNTKPGTDELVALARAGGVSVEWLATGEEPPLPVDKEELVDVVSYILELKGFNVGEPLSPESLARLIAHLYVRTLESRAAGQTLSANEALARVRDWAESSTDSDFDS